MSNSTLSLKVLLKTETIWNCDTRWNSNMFSQIFNVSRKYRSDCWSVWVFSLSAFHTRLQQHKSTQPECWPNIPIPTCYVWQLWCSLTLWWSGPGDQTHPEAECTQSQFLSSSLLTGGPEKWQCWCKVERTGQVQLWLKSCWNSPFKKETDFES